MKAATRTIENELFDHAAEHPLKKARRVASWIGPILKAIDKIAEPRLIHKRQVAFTYGGKKFKARFNHFISWKGGVEIINVRPWQGSPDGKQIVEIKNKNDVKPACDSLKSKLDKFVKK